jgi:hypothetical protein
MAEAPPYRFIGRSLTAKTFRFAAHELFAGRVAKRAEIVRCVCDYHNISGGTFVALEDIEDTATEALKVSIEMGDSTSNKKGEYTFVANPQIADPEPGAELSPAVPAQQDESEDEGVGDVWDILGGAYNPRAYDKLEVDSEVRDLFQYIQSYKAKDVEVETQMKCGWLVPYIPAIGKPNNGIIIPRPDGVQDGMGIQILAEPAGRAQYAKPIQSQSA